MIGAIFGDIVGSVYEFDNIKTKEFPLFGWTNEFTDDTVMTLAVAEAILQTEDLSHYAEFRRALVASMHRLGEEYPYAGYGLRFERWLAEKETEPYGSYGNGSAMRVSPVAWCAGSLREATVLAQLSAEVTHSHPEGIKGAVVTAGATYLARTGASMEEIRAFVSSYYDIGFTLDAIRDTYRFNETCMDTVPQAMVAFLESSSFEDAIRNGISIGGDSDTLCAITGAVAEAYYGVSEEERRRAVSYLDENLCEILFRFEEKYGAMGK